MTVTELDARVALIIVDLQAGTLSSAMAHPVEDIVGSAISLLAGFRAQQLPIVFTTVAGTPPGRTQYSAGTSEFPDVFLQPVVGLAPLPGEFTSVRRTWSAFDSAALDDRLKQDGVTQVVLAGVATTFGIESTARAAYDLGYSVVIVSDATTDRNPAAHDDAFARVFPALGQSATTGEIAQILAARPATPPGG